MIERGSPNTVLEMGYSVDEFVRVLPAAMRDWRVSGGPLRWRVQDAATTLDILIDLEPLPERRMGALRLPVLAVTIAPQPSTSPASMDEFTRRFERGFHRGGG